MAVFPKSSGKRSRRFEIAPVLAESIGVDEAFVRFILSASQYAATTGRVKAEALIPLFNEAKARYETSVHRCDGLAEAEIWALGYEYVENLPAGRKIKARGMGSIRIVVEVGLTTDVNGPPFPRHVDLVGWPPSTDAKHARKMCAVEIADKMRVILDPR